MQSQPIAKILFRGCSVSGLPIQPGSVLTEELLEHTRDAAKAVNERLEVLVSQAFSREDYDKLPENIKAKVGPPACDHGVNVTIYDPALLPQRIKIEPNVQETKLIERVMPQPTQEPAVVQLEVVV